LTTIALVAVIGVYRTDLWTSWKPSAITENSSGTTITENRVPAEPMRHPSLPVSATPSGAGAVSNRIVDRGQFISLLARSPAAHDLNAAFTNLFALWAVDYPSAYGATGCEKAISTRLGCHWAQGSWDQFLRLNQPALIWQSDEASGRKRYYVVAAVRRHEADVDVGESRWTVSTDVLKSTWTGKYLVLWRPPALDVELIRPGDRGQIVVWLRRNLERVQGVHLPSTDAEVFDPPLVESVRTFQHERRLAPDGLVGELTLMHLSAETGDVTIPLLTDASENQ
jgi:general secretion pathway protein A